MARFLQALTLANLSIPLWQRGSYALRAVGMLAPWRTNSVLMQQGEAIAALLASLVFALSPFVDNGLIGFMIACCGMFWAILTLSDTPGRGLTPIHLLVGLYWLISLLATALSPIPKAAAVGFVKLSLYLSFFVVLARILRVPRLRNWMIGIYLMTALLVSGYGIRQNFLGVEALATWVDPTSDQAGTTRVYSYLGNPNLLAAYLIPAVALSVAACFVWKRPGPKLLAVFMTLCNTACLVLTYSRGGWIGLVLTVLFLAILLLAWWSVYLPPFWRKWAVPTVAGGLVVVVGVAVLVLPPLRSRVFSMFLGRGDSSNNFRINVWNSVLKMIRDRPILGIGPGNTIFNKIYPLYQQPKFTALSAYSIFLEIAVETGIVGIACFGWLLSVVFSQGWTQLQRLRTQNDPQAFWLIGAIATIPGELGQGLFDTVWYRPEVNTLWWLSVALIASYYVPRSQAIPSTTPIAGNPSAYRDEYLP